MPAEKYPYSSDCLVYCGNIQPVFSKVSGHMTPGAIFAFSVEELKEDAGETDFKLRRSGRFAHTKAYVKSCL